MKAAKSFSFGDGKKTHRFAPGDEVPDAIVDDLGDQADTLILELAAKNNPDVLSREQLLVLAGLSEEEAQAGQVPAEFDEDAFREGFENFSTKGDLIEWAETLGVEGLEHGWTRTEIEDAIVGAYTEDEDE